MELIRGIVDPKVELKLIEAKDKSVVDGKHIIGVMEGNFFVPGGISRNKRFYSKGLWKRTLSNESVIEKLADRSMYGTIGHDTPVNDESLAKGLLTHITDKLYIDEKGSGIGRALILNTPSGRNLKTVLGAGGKVYVSSRALGTFEGKTSQGVPKVKEDDYELKGFDAVLDPGFLEANPKLTESLEYPEDSFKSMINECYSIIEEKIEEPKKVLDEENKIKEIEEKLNMDKNITESILTLTKENAQVRIALEEALKGKETSDTENSVFQSENENLRKQLKEQEDAMDKKKKDDEEEDEEEEEKAKKKEESEKAFEKEYGTKEEIKTAFETLEKQLDAYKEFGSAEEVKTAFESIEKFEEEYGTAEEIRSLVEFTKALGDKQVSGEKATKAESLATELGVSKEKVETLMAKDFDEDAIKEFFKDLKESMKVRRTYSKNEIDENKGNDDNDDNPFKRDLGENILHKMKFQDLGTKDFDINEEKDLGETALQGLM